MKLLCTLCLLLGLAAFTGWKSNKSELVLQTADGILIYKTATLPARIDEQGNVYFEFKPSHFTTENAANNHKLSQLFIEENYRSISFTGTTTKNLKGLAPGASISANATGTLSFCGVTQGLSIPITVTKAKDGDLVYSTTALIDWAKNPQMQKTGKSLKLQGPIRFTLTPVLN